LGADPHLGADPAALQPGAEDRLRLAALVAGRPARIALGGIDHPPAALVEGVEHGEALVLVDRPAEHVAAETDPNAPEPGVFAGHGAAPWVAGAAHRRIGGWAEGQGRMRAADASCLGARRTRVLLARPAWKRSAGVLELTLRGPSEG